MYGIQILPFYLNLPQDAIGTVCHQSGLLSSDLHLIPCTGFIGEFQLEPLIPALPQLEHVCHRQSQISNISAAYANPSIMFFQSVRHDPFEKTVEEGG